MAERGESGMTPGQEPHSSAAPAADEQSLKRLSDRVAELEDRNAALEGFVAVAAHELVVPLVMAESYADLVTDRLDGHEHADIRADLEALSRGAARTRLLVESLLHEARASERPLRRRPVDLDAVVAECIALLRPEVAAREARIETAELPVVLGEEPLLASVFTNLMVNALKYNPRQGGAIRVDAIRENAHWRFLVVSEGPEIPPEERERIFEPYRRARGERRGRGAGLGLAICRRIVERHGGTIGVTSNGGGNAFYFTLPAR
jgi:signal transduction histidine kinase